MNALRILVAITWLVCQLKYDQRTNYVGAKREFVELIKGVDQEYQRTLGYEFVMYVPSPSHMVGVWERQIILLTTIINYILFNILIYSKYSDCHAQRVSKQTQYYNFMKPWLLSTAGHSIKHLHDPTGPESLTYNYFDSEIIVYRPFYIAGTLGLPKIQKILGRFPLKLPR